ncbi:MAG: hypothetical protein HC797_04420, partial [Anaerolineales bacterium]|nr:hypothetical protein [Anaerolineales bacterium]
AISKLGVMRRPGDFNEISTIESKLPGITQKIQFIDALLQPVSSSELRRRVQANEMARYYLTSEVYEYIESQKLYR